MLNRRNLIALGGAVAGGALLAQRAAFSSTTTGSAPPVDHAGHHPAPKATQSAPALTTEAFRVPMPLPPVAAPVRCLPDRDEYLLDLRPADVEIVPGLRTAAYTYGGSFVGPVIRARRGRPVRVAFRNRLDVASNVHLHGGHVPADSDGHPMDLIQPGERRVYDYPNTQPGTTLWYHDHAHGVEAEHVYRGLHGFYLIEDDDERRLGLPTGSYDVPIMLRDAQFDPDGAFVYGNPALRNTVLANGRPQPYFPVDARRYRFRLLNASNEGVFTLRLDGAQIWQIGTDGGLLPAPVARSEISFGSGERVEILVDFSRQRPGTSLTLTDAVRGPVVRFDVRRRVRDTSRLPDRMRALPDLPPATVEREVHLAFDLSGVPTGLVNGKPYDPERVDFVVRRGATEIWRVYNDDTEYGFLHNFHMHLVQFRVLDRDGAPMTPDDAGLKDTVTVPPGTSVRVQATFTDFLGRYAYHCHFLEHSSVGMMAQMEIVP
ncbi:multicopper oxidase domain-containing protein [Micromonospora sp. NPDC050980]|uniref:multicopper oxidase family protein n=1 Tax=Micromonospora sp. NPDC050980 TaxID=3155161 RepID=UPI0033E223BF